MLHWRSVTRYCRNLLVKIMKKDGITVWQRIHKRVPDLLQSYPYCSKCWVTQPIERRIKADLTVPKALEARLVGQPGNSSGRLVYIVQSKRYEISRDGTFSRPAIEDSISSIAEKSEQAHEESSQSRGLCYEDDGQSDSQHLPAEVPCHQEIISQELNTERMDDTGPQVSKGVTSRYKATGRACAAGVCQLTLQTVSSL